MRILTSRYRKIASIGYSWDSALLYATADDHVQRQDARRLECWELGGDTTARDVPDSPFRSNSFAALPDGKLIITGFRSRSEADERGDLLSLLVDPTGRSRPREMPNLFPNFLLISPTGDRLVTSQDPHGTRNRLLVAFKLPLDHAPLPEWTVSVKRPPGAYGLTVEPRYFDPSGHRFLSSEQSFSYSDGSRWALRWRSAANGRPVGEVRDLGHMPLISPRFLDDRRRFIQWYLKEIVSFDLLDLTGEPMRVKRRSHFTGLAVHPDGKRVFASNNDGTVREYDAVTLQELRAFDWKVGKPLCVAVSPDGATAAAGSDVGKIVVWDVG